jgi:hypothetical protein
MWAVKAITEGIYYGADKKIYKTSVKINKRAGYENKSRNVSYKLPTLRHNFSNGFRFINKQPLQVCKGELIWFLRGDTYQVLVR